MSQPNITGEVRISRDIRRDAKYSFVLENYRAQAIIKCTDDAPREAG